VDILEDTLMHHLVITPRTLEEEVETMMETVIAVINALTVNAVITVVALVTVI
jgi:hypothetical protein